METLIVFLIFSCLAAVIAFGGSNNRDKELYYLKNLKFLEENPNVTLSDQDRFGDYFISYIKNGEVHYHFYASRRTRNLQCPKIVKKFNCADSLKIGKRLSYLPEHNQW